MLIVHVLVHVKPEHIEAFKAATGLDVVHEYYNSEAEMITKLQTNPGAYDVIVTNCAWNGRASELGVIQGIDTAKISHWNDLNPAFRDSNLLNAGGKCFGVAWVQSQGTFGRRFCAVAILQTLAL